MNTIVAKSDRHLREEHPGLIVHVSNFKFDVAYSVPLKLKIPARQGDVPLVSAALSVELVHVSCPVAFYPAGSISSVSSNVYQLTNLRKLWLGGNEFSGETNVSDPVVCFSNLWPIEFPYFRAMHDAIFPPGTTRCDFFPPPFVALICR